MKKYLIVIFVIFIVIVLIRTKTTKTVNNEKVLDANGNEVGYFSITRTIYHPK